MLAGRVAVPEDLAERFLAFLSEKRTGSLTFNVKQGRIQDLDIREKVAPVTCEDAVR